MLATADNDLITQTGPGTPMGDVFRRYWHPVALSEEIPTPGGKPVQLKVLSEDLVLFRDDSGQPGLLGLRCSHRLTSLAYGRVEDGGIRCPFHGWLYDVSGRCLQQPGEPEESSFKDKIRHTAYPCREMGGMIFAYMGPPEKQPPLPRFETLVREDGSRKTDYYPINSNYLQNLEGALDPIHSTFLHMDKWSEVKDAVLARPYKDVDLAVTEWGVWRRSLLRRADGEDLASYGHFFMPGGFMGIRVAGEPAPIEGAGPVVRKLQSWYVPVDDEHCKRFIAAFVSLAQTDGAEVDLGASREAVLNPLAIPGPENDYFRDYEGVDTICGIPLRTAHDMGSLKGYLAQDSMVNETQGAIADRSREHLGVGDRLLIMTRKQLRQAVEDVGNGLDPRFANPEPDDEGLVRVNGADAMEAR
ncbi:MAG: Rieske 2Fe-2S domain-containing protein [Chloroflexi bacterium]|nr:Rieske 2Fe-2S domain-containing protein [Chloroflexota bacterium]MCH7654921.1 Rieske 2Fe-2S domain-containing protein [Chloroflexota bacterium]